MTAFISYKEFEVLCAENGVTLRDMYGTFSHYSKWMRRNKLKASDDIEVQRAQYKAYGDDPKGDAVRPEYRDLWHWFIHYQKANGPEWTECKASRYAHIYLPKGGEHFPDWAEPAAKIMRNKVGSEICMCLSVDC